MPIEFDDQSGGTSSSMQQYEQSNTTPKLVALIMKWGIASSEEGANKVLIGVAIASFLLTIFVIFKFVL